MKTFEKQTEKQIKLMLIQDNPTVFGANASPIVPVKTDFILVGRTVKNAQGEERDAFIFRTNLSEKAKKANPSLKDGDYLRVLTTDHLKETTKPDDEIKVGRKPWANNVFQSQQPTLFAEIAKRLKGDEKDKNFINLGKDGEGRPLIKLRAPITGAFLNIQVPGHNKIRANGELLSNAQRDIRTGEYGNLKPQTFREMRMFLYEHEFQSIMAMAVAMYQKQIEPMLTEEVKISVDSAGNKEKVIQKGNPAETIDDISNENDVVVDENQGSVIE